MRRLPLLLLMFAVPLPSICQQVDPAATHAIDQMLQGARIIELPEGKMLVQQNSWVGLDLPMFSEQKVLVESEFPTDVQGIQGVKRLVELAGTGDSKGLLTGITKNLRDIDQKYGSDVEPLWPVSQRFLVIAYQDLSTKVWKVSAMTSDTDTSANVANKQDYAKADRSKVLGAKPSLKRYWFALALVQDGKLKQARAELEGCVQMSQKEKADAPYKASETAVNAILAEIASVTGQTN